MSVVKHWNTSFPFFLKALWDKALELRLLVQKAFSCANRLPQVFFGSLLLFNLILALYYLNIVSKDDGLSAGAR